MFLQNTGVGSHELVFVFVHASEIMSHIFKAALGYLSVYRAGRTLPEDHTVDSRSSCSF